MNNLTDHGELLSSEAVRCHSVAKVVRPWMIDARSASQSPILKSHDFSYELIRLRRKLARVHRRFLRTGDILGQFRMRRGVFFFVRD